MTKRELLNLEHLKIAEEKKDYFVHVHCEDGWYLTDWDKEDIKEFHASVCMYLPIRDKYNNYYLITLEDYNRLMNEQRIVLEKEREEREKEMKNSRNIENNR
jgi:hypothetical protein